MNRQIEFRAWDAERKQMVFPNIMSFNENFAYMGWIGYLHDSTQWSCGEDYVQNPIWMQWTGLTDKSGTKIYEGDVVKCYSEFGFIIGHICFINGGFYVVSTTDISIAIGDIDSCYNEVLGNLYQHPELWQP